MKRILIVLLLASTNLFAQKSIPVNLSNAGIVTTTYVTEQQTFYHGEFYQNYGLNTSTGAIVANSSADISDFLPVPPSTSITMYATDSSDIYVYGWTYDENKNPISEIRGNALISSPVASYTFTTPSNAAYLTVYTKYTSHIFNIKLRVKSTNTISYQSPILPETFSGANQSIKLQNALNFQRFTSSVVALNGTYILDSNITLSSNNRIVMNNALLKTRNKNVLLSISNNKQTNSGNTNISITGLGSMQYMKIALTNVSNFLISGLTVNSSNFFAFTFKQCRYGVIRDIWFNDGVEMTNQDGIHLLVACHDIDIENIYGVTGDDMISVVNDALEGATDTLYEPYISSPDIFNINIRNIRRNFLSVLFNASSGNIRLLTEDGYKIHDVKIENIAGSPMIKIQDSTHAYKTSSNSTVDDMYNIFISNANSPINVYVPIKNSTFFNVPTVTLPDGSLDIYRKYTNGGPEFIQSVSGGVETKLTLK